MIILVLAQEEHLVPDAQKLLFQRLDIPHLLVSIQKFNEQLLIKVFLVLKLRPNMLIVHMHREPDLLLFGKIRAFNACQ